MHISSNPHRNECAIKFSQLKKNVPPSLKSYNNFIYRVYKEGPILHVCVSTSRQKSLYMLYIYIYMHVDRITHNDQAWAPPLEIEMQKKKNGHQINY